MQNNSLEYYGNFTPSTEDNWTFRVWGKDAYNLTNITANITIGVFLDTSWTYNSSVNSSGAKIGMNATLGNITILNDGNANLSFILSASSSTVPAVYFNESSFNLSTDSSKTVLVKAKAPIVQGEYPVHILINATTHDAEPAFIWINKTLISYVSGPMLLAEITEYDPSVTLGDERVRLRSSIKNLGNDTAQSVNATWIIPAGWSAKENLSLALGDILVGQTKYHDIVTSIGGSAGTFSIRIYANSSEGLNDSDSREVVVSEQESSTVAGGGGGSGGGGGGGGGLITVIKETYIKEPIPYISIIIKDPIEIKREKSVRINFSVFNSGETNISDFDVEVKKDNLLKTSITGITSIESMSQPRKASGSEISGTLPIGRSHNLSLNISVPSYINAGRYILRIVFHGKSGSKKEEVSFSKKINVIVLEDDKSNITDCLIDAEYKINSLEDSEEQEQDPMAKDLKINTAELRSELKEANKLFSEEEYSGSYKKCTELKNLISYANEVKRFILNTEKSVRNGVLSDDAIDTISLVKEAFSRGDFALAKTRMKNAKLMMKVKKQIESPSTISSLSSFINDNLPESIIILLLSLMILFSVKKKMSMNKIDNKMAAYKSEIGQIKHIIKDVQHDFFIDKIISKRIYDNRIETYQKRIASILQKIIDLQLRRLKVTYKIRDRAELQKEKDSISHLEKRIQRMYYIERIISKSNYEKMIMSLRRKITDIEKLMAETKGDKDKTKNIRKEQENEHA